MPEATPDRTEFVHSVWIKHMDVGGADGRVFVAADGTPGSATVAHLCIKDGDNQLSTGLSNLQIFGNETAARAAYPEIPENGGGVPLASSVSVKKVS